METIQDIINGCKVQDRRAQKMLFDRYAKLLMSVSVRYTPKALDPMDNLHDSFIKIFQRIETFDENKGNFEAWARRVVVNTAIEKLRSKYLTKELYKSDNYDIEFNDDAFDKMNLDDLMKVIQKLPDGYRQVFCMYEIEGYSHKEIADFLGIKEVSSRSNLCRSKKLLQDMLLLSPYKFNEIY